MIFIDTNVKGWKKLFIGSSSPTSFLMLKLPVFYLTILCTFQGVRGRWVQAGAVFLMYSKYKFNYNTFSWQHRILNITTLMKWHVNKVGSYWLRLGKKKPRWPPGPRKASLKKYSHKTGSTKNRCFWYLTSWHMNILQNNRNSSVEAPTQVS